MPISIKLRKEKELSTPVPKNQVVGHKISNVKKTPNNFANDASPGGPVSYED
jgi:hypothetical protein